MRAVPGAGTGSALGAAQVARYLGYSLGSAVTASVLAGHTPSGHALPTQADAPATITPAPDPAGRSRAARPGAAAHGVVPACRQPASRPAADPEAARILD